MFVDRWLQSSINVESESANDRQRSRSILRSLYKREGDHHPDDCAEDLGDADADNFPHMMHLQARLLEGTPLCKRVLPWSGRGRNDNKGICDRLSGESTTFLPEPQSALRTSAPSSAWNNAVFKSRNSTDPITARACNSGDAEKMKPMRTYNFARNDIPSRGQVPKGSERDRLLPTHMPNKFRDSVDDPTPPRPLLKDHGLEAEIGRPEFAICHLLNFLANRSSASSSEGLSLHRLAATGAKTTAHLLEAWMAEWGRVNARWSRLGRPGANLLQIGAAKSRKQRMQARVAAPPFDASLHDQLFADAATFGDLAGHAHNVSHDACAPAEDALAKPAEAEVPSRCCRYTVCEAANLTALRARRDAGVAVAGERRQEGPSARVDLLDQAGKASAMKDGFLRPTSVPECPDSRVLRREYYQLNKIGRAYESGPGLHQSCARETRIVAFNGLAVGEFDMIAAFYQIFLEALRPHVPDGAVERDFGRGQEILAAQCDEHKKARNRKVASMEKVLLKAHPGSSALALHLQTMADKILESMAVATKGLNACVLSLVFGGMYVAMPSMSDIDGVFHAVADHEMEKLLGIDSAAAASGAPEVGGLPCTQEEQRGREPCGGLIGAAAASGAPEGGGQLVAQEEQRDIEPDTQEPSMAGRWNEGDVAVSSAAHGDA
ncbi:unnamed protein product [Prorocentrum cordatum]|uniref:RNA-directed RNA polymerase n=1 Tax=Prorocentrum cordatum TaxID=2364126 RepID=A0ABN9U2K8_9DINO|nr:unnamed protein product [Polarella glacialis]